MNEQQMFIELGKSLVEGSFGATSHDDDDLERIGRRWFSNSLKDFQHALCNNDVVLKFLNDKNKQSQSQIVAAISDLILDKVGVMPVTTVATLIITYGLNNLCNRKVNL